MPDERAVRALLGERLERLGPAADDQLRHLDYVLELPQSSERIRLVAPFQRAGRTELRLPLDGREVTIRYRARAGRHRVTVDGHPGQVLVDAPAGVELRP
jgi:hypothetical protein